MSDKNYRINGQIRAREVRLVGEKGVIGVVPTRDAIGMAREKNLDLVEVAPNADPPVCRMMDYGKFLYDKAKRERKARKASKKVELKEIRLGPATGQHDIEFKVRDARQFLQDGCKVKVRVWFRGRSITYPELGRQMLQDIADQLEDVGVLESRPHMEGRNMMMILSPAKK